MKIDWFLLGFNDTSTLEGHFCRLPEKGRDEIEAKGNFLYIWIGVFS